MEEKACCKNCKWAKPLTQNSGFLNSKTFNTRIICDFPVSKYFNTSMEYLDCCDCWNTKRKD